jgi:hypothetical protein
MKIWNLFKKLEINLNSSPQMNLSAKLTQMSSELYWRILRMPQIPLILFNSKQSKSATKQVIGTSAFNL